jgi:tetratricopeptide (TPR) repeat protein
VDNSRRRMLKRSLNGRSEIYRTTGRYNKSKKDFERIIAISERPVEKIEPLIGLGKLYFLKGETSKASLYYKKGLRIAIKKKKWILKGRILNGLADIGIRNTNDKDALSYAKKALVIYKDEKIMSKEVKKGIAESLTNIGAALGLRGHIRESLEFYKKSLRVRSSIEDKEGMAINLNNIGVAYLNLRDKKSALPYLKKSLQLRNEIGYIQGTALCLNNIGIVYIRMGGRNGYKKGMQFFEESLRIQRKLGNKEGIATSLNNRAFVFKIRGEYDNSLDCAKECLRLNREIKNRFGMTINLNLMGRIYFHLGKYKQALSVNKREGEICSILDNEPRLMNFYRLKGIILSRTGRVKEGYRLVENALKISRKLSFVFDEAQYLIDLSRIIITFKGREKNGFSVKDASEMLKRGLDISRKKRNSSIRCKVLFNFSRIYLLKKNYGKAQDSIERALEIAQREGYDELLPELFYQKAQIHFLIKQKSKAIDYLIRAENSARRIGVGPILDDIVILKEKIKKSKEK